MIKKMNTLLREQRGFTLVELLAVIVILGIIAAIAIPSVGNIIAKSKFDASKAEAIQVLNSAKLYISGTEIPTGKTSLTKTELGEYLDKLSAIEDNYTVDITDPKDPKITATAKNQNKAKKTDYIKDLTLSGINSLKYED